MRHIAYLLPFVAVGTGLYVLHSAWFAILCYHFLILTMLLLHWKQFSLRILFKGWNSRLAFLLTLIGFLSGPAIYFAWPMMQSNDSSLQVKLAQLGLHGKSLLIFCIYYAISTPLFEETFWRGLFANTSNHPAWPDIFFAGYHVLVLVLFVKPVFVILSFLVLVITAWVWRLIAKKFNGLFIPLLSHFATGLSIISALFILSR
ncbi:MAG: CPBP family intramembrane metalloprotease [Actinobacteria bacterium]|nr:CPBP family intramembrane metalloprotease [Actinomycetota bacterium]